MTLSSTTNRVSYAGNGATTVFSFPYYFLADGDLVVIKRVESTGVETTQTITTHYTVSGAGSVSGGSVTMLAAPATGTSLIIYRDPSIIQELDLIENDALPAESLEEALDRSAMISQRLDNRMDRAVRLSDGFTDTFDPTLPSDIADNPDCALVTNAAGDGFDMGPTIDEISNAQTYATNASASASAAAASASAASSSQTAAAASATAAQAAVDAVMFQDVVFKTFADSPITITNSDTGKLFSVDATGGAVVFNLPAISGLTLTNPWSIGIKKSDSSGNSITINRNGTDVIDGNTSKTIGVSGAGVVLIPDTDPSPDYWTTQEFGASAGNLTVDNFNGDGTTTGFTLSVSPASENNTWVSIDGILQHKNTYSVSGTTLTFSSAPPTGTNNIEVISGTTLSIGTPSDGTVTRAKCATGGFGSLNVVSKTANYTVTSSDDLILCDSSGGAFTLTLPTAVGIGGRVYEIKKTDSSFTAVTIDGNGSETLDGSTTTTLNTQYESIKIVSDNSNWQIVERKIPSVWTSYTPTLGAGFGTTSEVNFFWRRIGDSINISANFKVGTVAASASTATLPSGLTINLNKVKSSTASSDSTIVGNAGQSNSTQKINVLINNNTTVDVMGFADNSSGGLGLTFATANNYVNNNGYFSFYATIPITGWNG